MGFDNLTKDGRIYIPIESFNKKLLNNKKIITLWHYPKKEKWYNFLNKLESEFNKNKNKIEDELNIPNIDIWKNNWLVEIPIYPIKEENFVNKETIDTYIDYYNVDISNIDKDGEFILIPVEKYEEIKPLPKKYKIMHLLNLKQKEKLKKNNYFGSKSKKDIEKGEWTYAKTKYMGEKFKIFKFEELFESTNNDRIEKLRNSDFIQEIIKKGWKPFLVGGFVRDYLLNKNSNDVDIVVVGCDKEELINLLKKYGKPDLVGEQFSVIKFYYQGEVYDIALPRTEKKTGKGYKGFEVKSNKDISLEEDLFRRDLTINSIAMDLNKNIVDPYGGVKDLKNNVIRVTNPKAFTEDPLRILRTIRFSARFDFEIAEDTKRKIKLIKDNISELSQERIIEEINKV
jgi:hypothetical protein